MRDILPELQAHLDTGTTTLCICWRITRTDGEVLGFTDHDRDLTFENTLFRASTGGSPAALQSSADLAVDNSAIEGVLSDEALNEDDLFAGLYDHAQVDIWRVNWAVTAQRLLLKQGTIGEVQRGKTGFSVEFRGLSHRLDEATGRIFQYSCDAVLGDARCGVDLQASANNASGQITALGDAQSFIVDGLAAFEENWFAGGVIKFTSGANAGLNGQIKNQTSAGSDTALTLWLPLKRPVAVNDQFTVTAGCDKRFETCREKFANGLNFRGHPHMPGNDFVTSYPLRGESNDGGKR